MSDLKEMTKVEIWEAATASSVYVKVRDQRNGGWRSQRVGGSGSKRIQLTVEERRFNQDAILDENLHLDPFSNGMLHCVQGDAKGVASMTDADLVDIIGLDDDDAFEEAVAGLESEVMVRRVLSLAEKKATNARFTFVRDLVDERYRVGGTQRTVQAMIDAGERISGFVVN